MPPLMKYPPLPNSFFTQNRQELFEKIPKKSLVIFASNPRLFYNNDTSVPFQQESNLYYLSGICQENTTLILYKDSKETGESCLFISPNDQKNIIWDGEKISQQQAFALSGIEKVYYQDVFLQQLHAYIAKSEKIFVCLAQNFETSQRENLNQQLLKTLKKHYPLKKYDNIFPILTQMRLIKKPLEVDATKKAIDITHLAMQKAAKWLKETRKHKKECTEYQLEAALAQTITFQGSSFAFSPIVASGKNACVLHYIKNSDVIQKKDAVLIDMGAQYAGYNSDITRVFPNASSFTLRQKAIYQAVDNIKKGAISLLKDHFSNQKNTLPIQQFYQQLTPLIKTELIKLGLAKSSDNQKEISNSIKEYMPHGISHSLGLDVHDVDLVSNRILKSGMIISVEPGLYVRQEGIGIRLEDNVFLKQDGIEVLSQKIPSSLQEIEELMQ